MDEEIMDYFTGEAIALELQACLKSGKEATVYLCSAHPRTGLDYVAVKVYKDIERRSFRDMGGYLDGRIGRTIRKRRDILHMMNDAATMQSLWVDAEYAALATLHGMGLSVPTPLARNGQALAMEFIGSGTEASPRLRDADLGRDEAVRIHETLMRSVERMLAADMIHGDLSPYNVLVRAGLPVIIDFPQVVDARYHSQAEAMLVRDVVNLRGFFRRWGLGDESESERIARELWRRYDHAPDEPLVRP